MVTIDEVVIGTHKESDGHSKVYYCLKDTDTAKENMIDIINCNKSGISILDIMKDYKIKEDDTYIKFKFGHDKYIFFCYYMVTSIDDEKEVKTHGGFMYEDIIGLINKAKENHKEIKVKHIIEPFIYVSKEYRHNGIGEKVWNNMINNIKRNYPDDIIAIRSGPLVRDIKDTNGNIITREPSDEETDKALIEQGYWLETHGFRNMNSFCGFEFSLPYIYINKSSKPVLEEIIYNEIAHYFTSEEFYTHEEINQKKE